MAFLASTPESRGRVLLRLLPNDCYDSVCSQRTRRCEANKRTRSNPFRFAHQRIRQHEAAKNNKTFVYFILSALELGPTRLPPIPVTTLT